MNDAAHSQLRAGAAEIDITPDFVVELAGFAARTQPSTGVLDPIFARALHLDDGGEKLLWIGCDLIALERAFVESFRAWASSELGLEGRQVLLSATHTHSAPATIHLSAAGEYSERYITLLMAKLQQVARDAIARAKPCELVAGSATLDLAIDRRGKPTAHVDPMVWALGFARADFGELARAARPSHDSSHEFIATVANYAMHPVALGHGMRQISPDWCGAASRAMSSSLAGKPIAMVTNGAAGNINPPANDQPPEVVDSYGKRIGDVAISALLSAKPQAARLLTRSMVVPVPLDWHEPAEIDRIAKEFLAKVKPGFIWEKQFQIALANWSASLKAQVSAGGARDVAIELQAIRIGEVTIVAVNGEMFTRFTDILRKRLGPNVFVVGYANAAFGYIPTREAYAEGGYEVASAHFFYNSFRPKPGGLELLADRATELVCSL